MIIANARNLSKKIGIRFVTVDAYFEKRWLYEKYLFKYFPKELNKIPNYTKNPNEKNTIAMYRDIHKE